MLNVDYTKDLYHRQRHTELIQSEDLQVAWSECAKRFYFKENTKNQRIFEFGGALGYNLLSLVADNACHLLEPSPLGRSQAAAFGIQTYATIDEVGDSLFDTILCRHVLEHVDNPLETLVRLKGKLHPAGKLVLVLPVEGPCDPPVEKEIDFHLFTWNPRTIQNLLMRAGFSSIAYRYQFFNGRRLCMPIYRLLGPKLYANALEIIGLVTRSKELVISCQ